MWINLKQSLLSHMSPRYIIKKSIIWPWGQRSRTLWYATHRFMVIHSHTKYHWHILKDKKKLWSGQENTTIK